jgi:putative methyltransferase (TIGR04325 family)
MQLLKELIPPFITKLLKRGLRFFNPDPDSDWHPQIYSSYLEALSNATQDDYQDSELVEVIFEKTRNYLAAFENLPQQMSPTSSISLSALGVILAENSSREIKVLDFGGACGLHYFQLRKLLSPEFSLKWCVVETPVMVEKAKSLSSDELYFMDDFNEAVKSLNYHIDLLHTSGTLQCVSNTYNSLCQIIQSKPSYILFNRLGLNRGGVDAATDVYTIHRSKLSQNGFGDLPNNSIRDRYIKYPFTFISENKFISSFESKYSIVCRFEDNSGIFEVPGFQIVGGAYLLRKNKFMIDSASGI